MKTPHTRLPFMGWIIALSLGAGFGCGSSTKATPAPLDANAAPLVSAPAVPPAPQPAPAPVASAGAATEPVKAKPAPAVHFEGAFKTPESVLYDEARDRYLVSNINGGPGEVDNNGFISILAPDGKVENLTFIEGGKNAKNGKPIHLDAPKGLALVKNVLYVSDINTLRSFDAVSGAPLGEVKIEGATFLNDVAASPDGKVYVTDSGMKHGSNGFEPTGTDAVYVVEKGKAKALAKSTELLRPNGIAITPEGPVLVTFGGADAYLVDSKGAKQKLTTLPQGSLDGIVAFGDELLVSSWTGKAIYRGKLGGSFAAVLEQQESPADIGWDSKRKRILIPHFTENSVESYDLK